MATPCAPMDLLSCHDSAESVGVTKSLDSKTIRGAKFSADFFHPSRISQQENVASYFFHPNFMVKNRFYSVVVITPDFEDNLFRQPRFERELTRN